MVTLSILLLLIATSLSYIRIPLNWLDKEELATAIPTTLPTTQLISEAYVNNYLNKQYSIQIYAGSPPQLFNVQVSTGSPWLWIPSLKCKLSCHQATNYFDSNSSSTYKYIGRIKIKNEGYSFVIGDLSTETFKIGELNDMQIKNQNFILANQNDGYDGASFDGILGLEYNFTMGYLTFFDRLHSSKQISNKIFSVYLSDNGFQGSGYDTSTIIFGGYDLFYAQNKEIKFVNLTDRAGRWSVPLSEVLLDDFVISTKPSKAFFDVGASVIYAPKTEFDNIASKIAELGSCWHERGHFVCDCSNYSINKYPSISFSLGLGTVESFSLDPQNYFLKHDSYCYLLFEVGDYESWTFGSVFLRKYYTIFDAENGRIGLVLASQELGYPTIEALEADSKLLDANKIKNIDSKTEKALEYKYENISYWAITGILLICVSGFVCLSSKMSKGYDEEAYYQKINA